MLEPHWCWNCKYRIRLGKKIHFCIYGNSKIPDYLMEIECDFWRKEHDILHDHDAMVRSIEKNNQDVHREERYS